ncbi:MULTISPECIES: hypothetical protein [Clostridium]|uniref:Uncharacterized protein n=1 Tax=Clostridium faecium TaxID=2762223 RepID=A0ABR8YML7_9CLOT|nr:MULTISPECIES: hypothetical protein [Clostridium]MBD8045496.1 hypothetical protein [Clostridium faecium]
MLIFILIVINIPIYKIIFKLIFNDMDELKESIKYHLTPDFFSLLRGEYFNDIRSQFKLSCFIISCGSLVALEYYFINKIIDLVVR